jgi:hypothetical protein
LLLPIPDAVMYTKPQLTQLPANCQEAEKIKVAGPAGSKGCGASTCLGSGNRLKACPTHCSRTGADARLAARHVLKSASRRERRVGSVQISGKSAVFCLQSTFEADRAMGYPLILPKNSFDSSHLAENRVQGLGSVKAGGKCACPAQSHRPPAEDTNSSWFARAPRSRIEERTSTFCYPRGP